MAVRVLFAWEMGRNFGHVTQIVPVAEALLRRGATIHMALRNPAAMAPFSGAARFQVFQAPFRSPGKQPPGTPKLRPLIYADDLHRCGYDQAKTLASLIGNWQQVFSRVQPDVLIAQAAPTALLASHGMPLRRFSMGGSFDVPPATAPLQGLRYWENGHAPEMAARESRMLATINTALHMQGRDPLKAFRDFLVTDKDFLCTLKEMEHYPDRGEASYYGALSKTDSGAPLNWAAGASHRVLAYIRPEVPVFAPTMAALAQLPADHDVIVSAPGLPAASRQQIERPGLRVVDGPVRLDALLPACDLCINHATHGTCSAALLAGVPLLMLPGHIEQLMQARVIARNGMGLGMSGGFGTADVLQTLKRILADSRYRNAARALQAKYRDLNPEHIADRLADEIMTMSPLP
jgi:UDP:flavonoid glycosyltransferase YjiC (YdhE family)